MKCCVLVGCVLGHFSSLCLLLRCNVCLADSDVLKLEYYYIYIYICSCTDIACARVLTGDRYACIRCIELDDNLPLNTASCIYMAIWHGVE